MDNVVTTVVAQGLCSGCGVCAGVCPRMVLTMRLTESGDPTPEMTGECAENCNLCLKVCPFASGSYNPRSISSFLWADTKNEARHFQQNIGWYRSTFLGFCRNETQRLRSSSGGLLTWCLTSLLEQGIVNGIMVPRMVLKDDDFDFVFHVARSIEDIKACAGSIYYPVSAESSIRDLMENNYPDDCLAMVGVPCLVSAIRNASELIPRIRRSVRLILGVACGMYQNRMYTEMLLAKCGLTDRECGKVNYRGKASNRRANNYAFIGHDRLNQLIGEISYDGLPYFLGRHAYFRLNSCNYCRDVFAESADACFMDAWLPDLIQDWKGTSQVVVRNQVVEEILLQGKMDGHLDLRESAENFLVKSQAGHIRRKQELIHARAGDNHVSQSWSKRMDWFVQRKTQNRSKWAWRSLGRAHGLSWFWLGMLDLLILQIILVSPHYLMRLLRHLIKAIRMRR